MRTHQILLASLAAASILGTAHEAAAERRHNSLAEDVAVRHRKLLVKNRFEVAPLFESTVNADYRHIVGGGLKLEYHITDKWSIGVIGVASASLNTALVNKIVPTLANPGSDPPNTTREPSQTEYLDHLNSMPFHGAAFVSLTPWYGKLAAFSQAYVAFDFYFQAGVAFAQLQSTCPAAICSDAHPGQTIGTGPNATNPDENPNNDPPLNSGSRLGLYLGGGIHVFLNDFLALDLTVRDYAFADNPSGADVNADLAVTSADTNFLHHLFFGAGLSIMLPATVKRTP